MLPISTLMKQHSRYQVEIKNHYPVDLKKRKISYTLDLYLLSPYTLNVNQSSYSRSDILSNTQIYTRYTIYETTLDEIIRENNDKSPLFRIEELLKEKELDNEKNRRKIYYELRVLANTFLLLMDRKETELRNLVNKGCDSRVVKEQVIQLNEKLGSLVTRFRKLESLINKVAPWEGPEDIRRGYDLADETISLTIERMLFPLLHLFNERESIAGKKKIKKLILREIDHRKEKGYALIDENHLSIEEREKRVYREGILKKWAQSVNYMDKKSSSINNNAGHILAAIAASVAMTFAVLATVYANRFFVTYSLPWIGIAIISYSLKDRIKEGLRTIFQRMLPHLVSDKTDNLYDALINKAVGRARLTVEHKRLNDVPRDITLWYGRGESAFKSILPGENILHFRRQITMNRSRLMRTHIRLNSLTEIFRFNLKRYIENMDDPEKELWYFKGGIPCQIMGHRVYRLKFAVRIRQKGGEEVTKFYRVHMRQDGIVRIEEKI
jgi:hypothetical protein